MFVNSLFAFYSWIELGSHLVGESAPPALRAVPVWTSAVRERAEQLLAEALSFARPDGSNEPLGGGRQRAARELDAARRLHYGAQDANVEPPWAERAGLSAIDLPEMAGAFEICKGLPPEQRTEYLDVEALVLEPYLWGDLPKPCHRISARDEEKLQDPGGDGPLWDGCGLPRG